MCDQEMRKEICEAVDNSFQGFYNVLKAMKERRAVKPIVSGTEEHDGHGSWWYVCGNCGQPIDKMDRYCRWCGRSVKWK